jgi:ubiquinol-cytochrome c reductase cytochrome b subunit
MHIVRMIGDYLDIRLGVRDLMQNNLTRYLLPRNINAWYSMGAVLIALFAIQFVSGILLLVYYIPNIDQAFDSVKRIMNEIPYGWLVRYVHAVGANVTVIALFLHMLSALFMGSYKNPRELTWTVGFLLFLLTLGMSLTGYLLPWSQLSFWATTVATDTAAAFPWIGEVLVRVLRGGEQVGQETLGRFFALHIMGFPFIFGLLVFAHLFLVRRVGISPPPFGPDYRPHPPPNRFHHQSYPDGIPFFPNYMAKELGMLFLFLTIMMAIVFYAPWLFLPPEAFAPANPFSTPRGIKPEWYFLASYQMLRILPNEVLGIFLQIFIVLFLLFLPFIDRGWERRPARRPFFVTIFIVGVLGFIVLTVWGGLS